MKKKSGFTLVELLVVVAIIALLLGILLPALGKARETAKEVACAAQLKGIGTSFITFTSEHNDTLPGGTDSYLQGTEHWQGSWAGREIAAPGDQLYNGPYGTLLPYLGITGFSEGSNPPLEEKKRMTRIYRCPSLQEGPRNEGVGSNGTIDYAQPGIFAGAKLGFIPSHALAFDHGSQEWITTTAPLLVEEDPEFFINNGHPEPAYANNDQIGTWHNGGSNIVASDGSSQRVAFSGPTGPKPKEWRVPYPLGGEWHIDSFANNNRFGYGKWGRIGIGDGLGAIGPIGGGGR